MLHVVVPAVVVGFSVLFHFIVTHVNPYRTKKHFKNVRRVLFVIAHPDDECMFFGPTIVQLCRQGCEVHLLCLSSGNFYQQGKVRKNELRKSCALMGIDSSYVTIVEHTKLPDNPKSKWRDDLVGNIILKHIIQLDVDTIITFDSGGISGHRNHVAVYYAMSHLSKEGLLPENCKVFTLDTVNILRKYASLFDIPWSYLTSEYAYILSPKHLIVPQRAMCAHASQMLWYRWLYIYLSRYMLVNTYAKLAVENNTIVNRKSSSYTDKLD